MIYFFIFAMRFENIFYTGQEEAWCYEKNLGLPWWCSG